MKKENKIFVLVMAIYILATVIFVTGFVRSARAQSDSGQPAMQRAGEQTLEDGILIGSIAQLDGGSVVISLAEGESAWDLVVTRVGDGMQSDRVVLPWGKPARVSLAAAGATLHVTVGWDTVTKISAYSWQLASPFSREYSLFVPVVE